MRADLFDYELPEELIAKHPPPERDGGRLLKLEAAQISHLRVSDWPELVEPGSLLVLNETRVMPARLHGVKLATGGKIELLLLRPEPDGKTWLALGKASKAFGVGQSLQIGQGLLEIVSLRGDGEVVVRATGTLSIEEIMARSGETPIPPYLKRGSEPADAERYQTIFAKKPGSVAAPTAGLHLTPRILERLHERNIEIGRLILHVGIGTFRPVSAETAADHVMHAEEVDVSPRLAEQIQWARSLGRRVVAVGTTVVRALESASHLETSGLVRPFTGTTRLLITPGFQFRVVDALLTNFHQPRSTLLMLVSAFAGYEPTLRAYREAVAAGYRFLSYGDAMWIPGRAGVQDVQL